jgi:hypothetical protein
VRRPSNTLIELLTQYTFFLVWLIFEQQNIEFIHTKRYIGNKKETMMIVSLISAQDWIRTSTPVKALRPEHSASTNFATWAGVFSHRADVSGLQI